MTARIYRPGPPLGGFVECLWYFERSAADYPRERALPTGTVELVFSLRSDRLRVFSGDADEQGQQFNGSVVCGAHSGYFVLDTSRDSAAVGIHFRPGGAAPFLCVPAAELTDRHVSIEDVWGSRARELRERLLDAESPEAMFALVERALLARLKGPLLPHPAAAYALRRLTKTPAIARIGEVRGETGYSAKRFIEIFRDAVGLTPKLYCRIQRFQTVIERLAKGQRVEWTDVALDSGYYDQSHLNREFRAFSGVTPGNYRPVSGERPNHVAVEG